MFVSLLALLAAVALSVISAYYSVIGLAAIFAAAAIPIMIMGATLEFSKIATILWLHYNWDKAQFKIKSYLVSAVVILMLVTSMGSFGFLSKSHSDQEIPSGDIEAKVQLFDEKIKTERDNIDLYKKALVQMSASVDQLMSRTTDDLGATKAANLRKTQTAERNRLQRDISIAQNNITKLQEERAPIASQYRKVVADVGPIRYIAALIYGDKPDNGMLESAVRIVIILIVLVFDPLAIVLLLAATISIDYARAAKAARKEEELKLAAAEKEKTIEDMLALVHAGHNEELIAKDNQLEDSLNQVIKEKIKAEEYAQAVIHLDSEMSNLHHELSSATNSIVEYEHTINELHTQLHVEQNNITVLTEKISNLESAVSLLATADSNLQTELDTLISEYTILEDKIVTLQSEIASLTTEYEASKEKLLVAEDEISKARKQSSEFEKAYNQQYTLNQKLQDEYNSLTTLLDHSVDTHNKTIQAFEEEKAKLDENIALEQAIVQKLTEDKQILESCIAFEKANVVTVTDEKEMLLAKLNASDSNSQILLDEIESLSNIILDNEIKIQSLTEERSLLESNQTEVKHITDRKLQELISDKLLLETKMEEFEHTTSHAIANLNLSLQLKQQEIDNMKELTAHASSDAAALLKATQKELEDLYESKKQESNVEKSLLIVKQKELNDLNADKENLSQKMVSLFDLIESKTTDLDKLVVQLTDEKLAKEKALLKAESLTNEVEVITKALVQLETNSKNAIQTADQLTTDVNRKNDIIIGLNSEIKQLTAEILALKNNVVSPVVENKVPQFKPISENKIPTRKQLDIPNLLVMPDNFPMASNAGFGTDFPVNPIKGDLFLRVDFMPSKLYKWLGSRWVEIDKNVTDEYAYDQSYIDLLVAKLSTGEYSVEDLSETEIKRVNEQLAKPI